MGALRHEKSRFETKPDNVLYVLPPWAVRERPRRDWRVRFDDAWAVVASSEIVQTAVFEVKVVSLALGLTVFIIGGFYGLYFAKCDLGIDLVPDVHMGGALPFVD